MNHTAYPNSNQVACNRCGGLLTGSLRHTGDYYCTCHNNEYKMKQKFLSLIDSMPTRRIRFPFILSEEKEVISKDELKKLIEKEL